MSTSDELLPPLHDSNSYPPPLAQLLALGEDAARQREWPDYLALGIGREHVPELVRIARSWLVDV